MVYKFFDKKNASLTDKSAAGSGVKSMSQNKRPLDLAMQQLPEELHKSVIRKFKKKKYIQHLKTIFGVLILADMQLISKFNKGFRFLLCVIDIFSKYAWVVPLKDKKMCKYC